MGAVGIPFATSRLFIIMVDPKSLPAGQATPAGPEGGSDGRQA